MKNEPWQYHTTVETAQETAISIGTGAAYTIALTQIFNPIALVAGLGYGAAKMAKGFWSMHREDSVDDMIKAGVFAPLPEEYKNVQTLVDQFTEAAEMKPHRALLATDKFVAATMPWYLRWMMTIPEIKDGIMENVAATLTTMDVMIMSKKFLEEHSSRAIRFTTAHEISHAKTEDSYKIQGILKGIKKTATRLLGYGLVAVAGANLIGIGLPSLLAAGSVTIGSTFVAGGLMLGASVVANWGLNYCSRIQERRADRNAIYLTRDLEGAIELMNDIMPEEKRAHKSPLSERATHPSYYPRMENLQASYELASQYPVLLLTDDFNKSDDAAPHANNNTKIKKALADIGGKSLYTRMHEL